MTKSPDDSLTEQELLTSLCNLYINLINENSTESIADAVLESRGQNIHPYNVEVLCELWECDPNAVVTLRNIIEIWSGYTVHL